MLGSFCRDEAEFFFLMEKLVYGWGLVSGFGSGLKVSTNLTQATSGKNFCRSIDMPLLATWMPSM